jgi:hypothetical protein
MAAIKHLVRVAENALRKGYPIYEVAEIAELSHEKVKEIKGRIDNQSER